MQLKTVQNAIEDFAEYNVRSEDLVECNIKIEDSQIAM